jgi:hypothetical protein
MLTHVNSLTDGADIASIARLFSGTITSQEKGPYVTTSQEMI